MNENKDLPEEQEFKLSKMIHQKMVITDPLNEEEPLPIIEETLSKKEKFAEKFVDLFCQGDL
jgi:hypothetical protein